ncbi:MAG: 3-methyl-2-oxobutanoate hydroxymethyltransferase, partial [Betaproteobacteria bacterium]|nr:3-methyl-2-oxobutanoate hydroxymethyltransferase [Betaproteobacteria bacterium]
MAKVTSARLQAMRVDKDPVTMLTCTDASFAGMLDKAEVDMFLIGDSLGMVIQGDDSTLGVTMDDMVYHTRC